MCVGLKAWENKLNFKFIIKNLFWIAISVKKKKKKKTILLSYTKEIEQ